MSVRSTNNSGSGLVNRPSVQDKPAAEAKAPVRAPAKTVAAKKAPATKVADKSAAEAARKSSL